MKKIKYALFTLLAVMSVNLHGDIILPDPPSRKVCAKIKNTQDYPDIEIIAIKCYLPLSKSEPFIVEPSYCIKLNNTCHYILYAVKKDYLKTVELDKIDWDNDKNVIKSNTTLDLASLPVDLYDKSIKEVEVNYTILGFDETSMALHLESIVYKYKKKKLDLIERFIYSGDASNLRKTFD